MSLLKNDSKKSAVIQNIDLLVDSQSGIELLKELLLSLAIRGKLNERTSNSSNSLLTYDLKALRLEEDRLWGLDFLQDSPETWVQLPLAKLGDWGSGGTPSRGNKEYYGGDIPWIIIGDLNDGLVTKASNSITTRGLQESSASKVPVGAVLVAMYGSIGKCGIAGIECATNQAIAHCIPNKSIISTEYLFYLIRALKPRLLKQGRGLAQQNISQTILKHLMVIIPPLEEQEAIISTIQELMAVCDQLEVAKKSRNEIETSTRKSAVDAVSTALTREELQIAWKQIRQNWDLITGTSESMESMRLLIHDLATRGVLSGEQIFEEVLLKDISQMNYGYTESANLSEVGPKFLRITDIQLGKVDWETVPYCPISSTEEEKHLLKHGDLVFARTGATTGKSFLLSNPPRSVCASYLIRVRPDVNKVLPEYLYLYFQSGQYWEDVKSGMSGTAQGGFNSSKLGALSIRIPSLASQSLIVRKTHELLLVCENLGAELEQRQVLAGKFARSVVSASS